MAVMVASWSCVLAVGQSHPTSCVCHPPIVPCGSSRFQAKPIPCGGRAPFVAGPNGGASCTALQAVPRLVYRRAFCTSATPASRRSWPTPAGCGCARTCSARCPCCSRGAPRSGSTAGTTAAAARCCWPWAAAPSSRSSQRWPPRPACRCRPREGRPRWRCGGDGEAAPFVNCSRHERAPRTVHVQAHGLGNAHVHGMRCCGQ